MKITYRWRGDFENAELNELQAEAFATLSTMSLSGTGRSIARVRSQRFCAPGRVDVRASSNPVEGYRAIRPALVGMNPHASKNSMEVTLKLDAWQRREAERSARAPATVP